MLKKTALLVFDGFPSGTQSHFFLFLLNFLFVTVLVLLKPVPIVWLYYSITILLMRDCQKIFPVDQQRYFPIFNFRLWQADGCGELVRSRRTQSILLLDRWIWERRNQQCESILHNTFNVEKPQWPTNAQMFSWNMSGNPMEQYFTEWESGYPKNRCKNFFLFSTCFFYLNLHRTCELWVLQCSR